MLASLFQSSPGLLAGCNLSAAPQTIIIELEFQSSPGLLAGCNPDIETIKARQTSFQSSPGLLAGCNTRYFVT